MIDPHLAQSDPEVAALVAAEERREFDKIRLIPSENYASRAVLEATGSVFTNKYSEGYAGKRYYEGQQCVDPLEQLAIARAKALFGADHANVQPYSGSPANLAVYFALLKPGDTVMGMALPHGGHLTHGWNVSITGSFFRSVQYGVQIDTGLIDYGQVRELAVKERPKLIIAGATAYPRIIDFAAMRAIADEVGRAPAGGHGPHRGPRGRRRAPDADPARARRLDDDAQDAARAARGDAAVQGGDGEGDRQGRVPRPPGRAAQPHDGRHRRRAEGGRHRRVQGLRAPDRRRTRGRSPRASPATASSWSPAAPTTT